MLLRTCTCVVSEKRTIRFVNSPSPSSVSFHGQNRVSLDTRARARARVCACVCVRVSFYLQAATGNCTRLRESRFRIRKDRTRRDGITAQVGFREGSALRFHYPALVSLVMNDASATGGEALVFSARGRCKFSVFVTPAPKYDLDPDSCNRKLRFSLFAARLPLARRCQPLSRDMKFRGRANSTMI